MRLIIREVKKRTKSSDPMSFSSFMDFVEKFKQTHGNFDARDLNSRDALIQFAKSNLANNEIVKSGLVNNELITFLQNHSKKTNDYQPTLIAGVLLSRFRDWHKG